ncbi:four helix bundle protein [Ohessyouella blattaphilus]|uniref:Four helix bundle protein n=1 Tax=Ohessyouella blattaphilus TaxID=2949333 RepID=A0ABT1ELT2_9FIRM|nr:four helix bundle protein [Ohessyouella blattaphilus]MCP1111486.1 four helix bundle protein [Ohessyouella blattaphilus]MCR8564880.1 four helix bundle protein [Ohessyouella blattaphilus]
MTVKTTMQKSELTIITKAKDLCSYVMTVTEKSPKRFRFTFVSRLQNLCLEIIESIYRANDLFLGGDGIERRYQARVGYQRKALTALRLLGYMAQISQESNCLTMKQYAIITKEVYDCQNLLGAWMNSDKSRYLKAMKNQCGL